MFSNTFSRKYARSLLASHFLIIVLSDGQRMMVNNKETVTLQLAAHKCEQSIAGRVFRQKLRAAAAAVIILPRDMP